jgi:uncharacterized protein (TIGR02757 family)
MTQRQTRLLAALDAIYQRYNRPEFIEPDPLAPVLRYPDPRDQEVVGLICACLAFGNVKTILASAERVLAVLPHPHDTLLHGRPHVWEKALQGFRHRYVTGVEMAALLGGMRRVMADHGSLGEAFAAQLSPGDPDVLPALSRWVQELQAGSPLAKNYLLSDPVKGSACKRLLMYLRWMVRHDAVDPGPWRGLVSPALLVAPIDTHMHRMARALRFTRRNTADLTTAREVTRAFARLMPQDPVRYDFALTRFGIRRDPAMTAFLVECGFPVMQALRGSGSGRRQNPK